MGANSKPHNPWRAILFSGGLLMLSLASQLSQAKGWADFIPDWAVYALWFVPIAPLGWWLASHERLKGARGKYASSFQVKPKTTITLSILATVIICICLSFIAARTWGFIASHRTKAGVPGLLVNPAQFEVSWGDPAPITYGTPLSETQLSAIPSVKAVPIYSPALESVLPAGRWPLTVTFTPEDRTKYAVVTKTVYLVVNAPDTTSKHLGSPNTPKAPAPSQPTPGPPTDTQRPVVVETAPAFGNLGDRAIALSNEIMEDLYMHGWRNRETQSKQQQMMPMQQMPTKPEEFQRWTQIRSSYFRFRFLDRVLDMRNEFAQLHLRDEQLDEFFKYQGMIEQANRQMAAANPGREIQVPILPQQIEAVAERLKVLANQIPVERLAPKALRFSISQVKPEKPEFSFEIVVTIETDRDLVAGYVAVEFNGPRAFTGTDFTGSKLIFLNDDNDIVGNKPLKEYLRAHQEDSYVLEIGDIPFTPKMPIHVVASGSAPFSVNKVTLFEK